jgi:hypothetical protein
LECAEQLFPRIFLFFAFGDESGYGVGNRLQLINTHNLEVVRLRVDPAKIQEDQRWKGSNNVGIEFEAPKIQEKRESQEQKQLT